MTAITTFDDGHLVCPCVTDHALSQCPTAAPRPTIPAAAGEDILLRWHGPTAHRAISLWAGDGHQEEMIEEVSAVRRISTWRSAPSRVVFEGDPGTQNENAIEGDVCNVEGPRGGVRWLELNPYKAWLKTDSTCRGDHDSTRSHSIALLIRD
jgi:hypothetical protein